MNILFLHSIVIAPEKGGIERVTRTLADCFSEKGNNVWFLAAKPTWREFADEERQFFLPDANIFSSPENAVFFETFLRERKVDAVIFQWADGKRFPFGEICRKLRVRVISAIHTDPCFYEQRLRGNGFFSRVKRWLRFRRQAKIYRANACCSAVTVLLSEHFVSGFLKHFPQDMRPSICVIPNPSTYENKTAPLSEKKKELLFVGRMERAVKQPHLLLQAWKSLQDEFPDWSLAMVGGGFDEEEIRSYAESLGLERVSFKGFRSPASFYHDASVFCMTSSYEGFGMVLVEAASYGCVPVAFDSFVSLRDIISDGETGIIVPAFDVEKYTAALRRLMANSSLRERLASAAFRHSFCFSKTEIADRWRQILEVSPSDSNSFPL